jgi:dTDP-4-amino-4,6-dideoxy-D-galactose acyltransferase
MTGLVEALAWDTEFFGFPIGRANLQSATPDTLRTIDAEARDLGIACLYGALGPVDGDTASLVQTFGHRLVEVALTFSRPAVPFSPKPTTSTVRRGTAQDLPGLEDAITTLTPWSRFATDPRFGADAALRMFRAWVERAARDGDEHMLLITEDDTGVTGLSTHVRTPVPRIDLMGVITQGSGASWALMAGGIEWADGGPIEGGPCAARNIAPLRFVEACGFSIVRSQYLFHRWLDEDALVADGEGRARTTR